MFRSIIRYALITIFCVLSYSCSTYKKEAPDDVAYLYAKALHYIGSDKLEKAKVILQQITDDYPFKDEALEAQIFLIWIYYLQDDLVSAEITIDTFLKYYVYNDYTPWVTYMNALVKYENILDSERDFSYVNEAFLLFNNIIKNSDSLYSKDAEFKLEALKYLLAKRSMNIAYYYLSNKNYIAALNRYKHILDYYQNTIFVEEAMYRLVYIWLILGMNDEAFRMGSVLGYNYPNSNWYKLSYDLLSHYTSYKDNSFIRSNKVQ